MRLLRRSEAARHISDRWGIPVAPKTLAELPVIGGGPKFGKADRIPLYDPNDLNDGRALATGLVKRLVELAQDDPSQAVRTKRPEGHDRAPDGGDL
jgi:hypothetical protein